MPGDLFGQAFEGTLEGHRALACRHHYEEMVGRHLRGEAGQFVPVVHRLIAESHLGMAAPHEVADEVEALLSAMEDDAAVEIAGESCQPFQPSVEARFELRPRRHRHLDAADGVERLPDARHDDLPAQSVEETLVELTPELGRHLVVHVHSDDDLRALELVEGVLDAVGDVGGDAHLCLRGHVGGSRQLSAVVEELAPLFLVVAHILVLIHHVEAGEAAVELGVPHQERQVDEVVGIFGVFHGYEHLAVVRLPFVSGTGHVLVAQDDALCRPVGEQGGDDAGDEDHDDHAVEHVIVHEEDAVAHRQVHTHHHHGDAAGSMGRGEAEHHVARAERQAESQAGDVSRQCLAQGAEEHDAAHHPEDVAALEDEPHVDEHTHTDEEIRDEESVADELQTVHQRRDVGNVAVEDESGEEGAEHALDAHRLRQGGAHEEHRQNEDELHHRVTVPPEEPARESGYQREHHGAVGSRLGGEEDPEQHTAVLAERRHQSCQDDEREQEGDHARPHAEGDARFLLQTIARHDGVGDEGVGRHDAAQQNRRLG